MPSAPAAAGGGKPRQLDERRHDVDKLDDGGGATAPRRRRDPRHPDQEGDPAVVLPQALLLVLAVLAVVPAVVAEHDGDGAVPRRRPLQRVKHEPKVVVHVADLKMRKCESHVGAR